MGVIFKGSEFVNKGEVNGTGGSISLFADNHLCNASPGIIFTFIIDFIPV